MSEQMVESNGARAGAPGNVADELRAAMGPGATKRPIEVFDIPPGAEGGDEYKSIGLVRLSWREEKMIAARTGSDKNKLGFEMLLQALVQVNGLKVSTADGTADKAVATMPPKVREMLADAYGMIHHNKAEDLEAFRKSRRTVVG